MFARIYAATTLGIDGRMIDVEVDVSPGLLGLEFVGDSTLGETVMSLTFHILIGSTDKFSTAILAHLFRPLCVDKSST